MLVMKSNLFVFSDLLELGNGKILSFVQQSLRFPLASLTSLLLKY